VLVVIMEAVLLNYDFFHNALTGQLLTGFTLFGHKKEQGQTIYYITDTK
jgi:hypothetical protein